MSIQSCWQSFSTSLSLWSLVGELICIVKMLKGVAFKLEIGWHPIEAFTESVRIRNPHLVVHKSVLYINRYCHWIFKEKIFRFSHTWSSLNHLSLIVCSPDWEPGVVRSGFVHLWWLFTSCPSVIYSGELLPQMWLYFLKTSVIISIILICIVAFSWKILPQLCSDFPKTSVIVSLICTVGVQVFPA